MQREGAEHVVLPAPFRVAQRLVGQVDQLEPLLGVRVVMVGVGMQLPGQAQVRLLDLVGGRVPGHAQNRVEVVVVNGQLTGSYLSSGPLLRACPSRLLTTATAARVCS